MSILKDPYVTPSRVKGVTRYLLQARGKREKRETLEAILSPTNLLSRGGERTISRNMVQATIRECIKMGLLKESEDGIDVAINSELQIKDDSSLPIVLSKLLLSTPEYSENHDFAKVLAWYLTQDLFDAPGNWQETEQQLREQIGAELLELNDARYGQFEAWSCYLGFSWRNALAGAQVLVPDPTVYLRQNLASLFAKQLGQRIPLGEFITRLGKYAPVFETGEFREEVEQQMGLRASNYLSSPTSTALRRLAEEGLLKLERLSDAPVLVLNDAPEDPGISHITWLGNTTDGGQR